MGDDDIEQRLAAAAAALREFELTSRRCTDLRDRIEQVTKRLAALRAEHADEQKDVERLEGVSLTRLLASLRGSRNDSLERERAEADLARYRVAEMDGRLATLRRELDAAQARRDTLASAPQTYAAVLADKERHLAASGDPRGRRLLQLADERGRLTGELHEIGEAIQAADAAWRALSAVRDRLGSASSWSTYDTFFGGGVISSAFKHARLDEAARAASHADRCLAVLRTELADIHDEPVTTPRLTTDGVTRFVDVWLDNIFTDLSVRNRIKQGQRNVAHTMQLVREVHSRLKQRAATTRTRLAAIEAERRELLTRQ
jgi:hypothetical protein